MDYQNPTQTPYQPYSTPQQQPPKKNSKVWLWVLLGVGGLCAICTVIALIAFVAVPRYISKNAPEVANQLLTVMPSVEAYMTVEPFATAEPAATEKPAATEAPAVPSTSSYIVKVDMAKDVKGDLLEPVDVTTVFGKNDVFHAVVRIEDAPENTKFSAVWYAEDVKGVEKDYRIDGNDIVSGGTRNLDFNLTPNNGWPTGTYRVEISVDGNLEKTVTFTVE